MGAPVEPVIDSAQSSLRDDALTPPAPFHRTPSGSIRLTRGGGAFALFGLPFFLAGVVMLLTAAGVFPSLAGSDGRAPVVLDPMGLVFLAVGGLMVFGRQWLTLDHNRGSILRQIGLLVPLRTEERTFSEFNAVVMSHDPGDSESAETYPVRLRASIGKDIAIAKPLQFGESRKMAEYLARLLRLQLIDTTTDRVIVVNPERAGESLRDRLSETRETSPPQRPLAMRCQIEENAGETRIVMPGGGITLVGYLGLILPLAAFLFAMLLAAPFAIRSANPLRVLTILLLIFGLPIAFAGVRWMLASKRGKTTVTASRSGLMIEQPRGRRTQTIEIQASDVLDLDFSTVESAIASFQSSVHKTGAQSQNTERAIVALKKLMPNPGIIVKSRGGLITIGEGLPADELLYLAWLLRKALTG